MLKKPGLYRGERDTSGHLRTWHASFVRFREDETGPRLLVPTVSLGSSLVHLPSRLRRVVSCGPFMSRSLSPLHIAMFAAGPAFRNDADCTRRRHRPVRAAALIDNRLSSRVKLIAIFSARNTHGIYTRLSPIFLAFPRQESIASASPFASLYRPDGRCITIAAAVPLISSANYAARLNYAGENGKNIRGY